MTDKLQHATITLERSYQVPTERVFSEFADPVARARWSLPPNEVMIYDETDFRQGGRDTFRCGPKHDPKFHGVTSYHLIVPNKLVISSETLEADGQHLGVSLTTLEFEPADEGTILRVKVQLVSLVGPGMIAGYEAGNKSALMNLSRQLRGDL